MNNPVEGAGGVQGGMIVAGNSAPSADIAVQPGYCQIFSGYLDINVPNMLDVQAGGILEVI